MSVCAPHFVFVRRFPYLPWFQPSARPLEQIDWLVAKYEIYRTHHAAKTLGQFFPSLYEEYFTQWPPAPTAQDIEAARGNVAVAISGFRKVQEHVCGFNLTNVLHSNQ